VPTPSPLVHRSSARDDLLAVALEQFAFVGYSGTSLSQIAEIAGYSKSSVLYHFAAKEALLEAALNPAIDVLTDILNGFARRGATPSSQDEFVSQFVDFLLGNRLSVHMFINQGQSLGGIPAIQRANALIRRLAESLSGEMATAEEKVRFGVALGGAAYMLVAAQTWSRDPLPDEEIRSALIAVVTELLAPTQLRLTAL
jgi:TetR/AcrR family transcriptional regulator